MPKELWPLKGKILPFLIPCIRKNETYRNTGLPTYLRLLNASVRWRLQRGRRVSGRQLCPLSLEIRMGGERRGS